MISKPTRQMVEANIENWDGSTMSLSRSWVEAEIDQVEESEKNIARIALVMAKARYQYDDSLAEAVLANCPDDESFIRILAWCSNLAARKQVGLIASHLARTDTLAA